MNQSAEARRDAVENYPNRNLVEALASHYSLVLPERQRSSLIGEMMGRRSGSSVEFQDRKDYTPGDDLRAVDWRAYARTDRLTVKLYREEVCPTVDIIVDTSLSMSTSPEKTLRRVDLAYLFFLMASKARAAVRIFDLGRHLQPLGGPLDLLTIRDQPQEDPISIIRSSSALRRGGIKILISDLLFAFAPHELVGAFLDADRLIVLQLLTSFENDPGEGGATVRLEEAEGPRRLDVRLDHETVQKYLSRLNAIRSDVARHVRAAGGSYCCLRDVDNLQETMRTLLESGAVAV